MNISDALPTFVITLREGIEATLVVGIVLALLQKAQRSHLRPWVYGGIGGGLMASLLVGLGLGSSLALLNRTAQPWANIVKPLLEGSLTAGAILLLSWMLLWMTEQAKTAKADVSNSVNVALAQGETAGWGIFSLIFIAVLREGFETVVFVAAQFQQGWMPVLGAFAGLLGAVLFGLILFQTGIKINLRRFFQVMGVLLLLIVAGLVISASKHFDGLIIALNQLHLVQFPLCWTPNPETAGYSCVLGPLVWDGHSALPERQFPGIFLKTFLGYREQLYLAQVIAYLGFLIIVSSLYFRRLASQD